MGLFKFFNKKTEKEMVSDFISLLERHEVLKKESSILQEQYNLHKSMKDDLYKSEGDLSEEQEQSIILRCDQFFKDHKKKVVGICNEITNIEKSVKNYLEKSDIKDLCKDIQSIRSFKKLYKQAHGEIKKSVKDEFYKAKSKPVKYSDIIVWCGGRILVLNRAEEGTSINKWCVPGGHVDPGEDFLTAAQRELFEETGLNVPKERFFASGEYKNEDVHITYFTVYVDPLGYDGHGHSYVPVVTVDAMESSGEDWICPYTELEDLEFIFDMKENIKKVLGITNSIHTVVSNLSKGTISKSVFMEFCKMNPDLIEKSNKTDFSAKERRGLANKGEALPDGSFPIRNSQDLKDAIKSVGLASNEARAKAWIIKRAKALGKESELPESWEVEKCMDYDKDFAFSMTTADARTLSKESLDEEIKVVAEEGAPIEDEIKKCDEKEIKKSEDTQFSIKIDFNDLEHAEIFKSFIDDLKEKGELSIESINVLSDIEKSDSMYYEFLNYANFLEGIKTRIKNIHWGEKDEAKHEFLDDLSDSVSSLEDKLMEAGQSEFGRFKDGEVVGEEIDENDPIKLIDLIIERSKSLHEIVKENENYVGEMSWIEDFLAEMKQTKYRLQMH